METYTLSSPPPAPPPVDEPKPKSFWEKFGKFILIGVILIGLPLTFSLGLLLNNKGNATPQRSQDPTPTTVSEAPSPVLSTQQTEQPAQIAYLAGKKYFDDSIAVITKQEPHRVLFLSFSRSELQKNFTQYTKVNYYNGATWLRESVTSTNTTGQVSTNPLVNQWTITAKPLTSRNQNAAGQLAIKIENQTVSFIQVKQSYEVSVRALPGFTKFTYYGEGTLKTVDGEQPAYVVYSQAYADSASNYAFLNTPERLKSSWMVFWDQDGNVYQSESLSSQQKNNVYQNYTFGNIYSPATEQFLRVAEVTEQRTSQNNQTQVNFRANPDVRVTYQLNAPLNKSSDRSYMWRSAYITGTIQRQQDQKTGVGLLEVLEPQ